MNRHFPQDPAGEEFEDRLRAVLRAEADTAETSPEALNLIRERTERAGSTGWLSLPWLRPAAAVGAAMLIAASVLMSTPQVREQVMDISPVGTDQSGQAPGGPEAEVAVTDPSMSATASSQERPQERPQESAEPESESSPRGPRDVQDCATPSGEPTAAPGGSDSTGPDEECEPTDEPSTGDKDSGNGGANGGGGNGDGGGGNDSSGEDDDGDGTGGEGGGTGNGNGDRPDDGTGTSSGSAE